MIFSGLVKDAINFAIQVHEIDRKQRRKGKDIPYIVHPLAVGLILARVTDDEETIAAGILHDTIEDSIVERKVTKEQLMTRFGPTVAYLVHSVTEKDKSLSWDERKQIMLDDLGRCDDWRVFLIKSADLISNLNDLLEDYAREGESAFSRFNTGKEKYIANQRRIVEKLLKKWPRNPLTVELGFAVQILDRVSQGNSQTPPN
ncbi:MAG: hypothetical protein A3F94_02530 [Candidatus Spechtbacteria bacterium RIFCSPLOWO2_12_FULL_38_22]|uniref:HD/PDEase domain-containing protein n=1 Tax=Candidatus Spechtbacteria bacterium RIFCSPLOWO2_12_FULL_38_22 TaxID=1802165 RepID=A0A1G2HHV6_9BACT|nr:MAG: hypothetical protein A2728_01105 [Candidatus Spechtbacteria bacterium RIFCSPHIGHO2_01_FULL_38_11]OGZ59455.1 MAG: hypothetical protein A3E58_00740 [Candidatus Spechtbacteria bacterium RIFCSPHIGHO2_12_FULL_38_30]OGZ61140.1 MAG: hypothetical protein A3A00_01040 [Candidatus Spechtbacteria bacterium RIFCSPLOWO2_01_FULL_38_20]OGZ62084.1 MAG: hypothetical protein A3F94_02530 [Candidatus Spechtbacteria bacterium RIFCSPLOWO2_12_FULL_38_22]